MATSLDLVGDKWTLVIVRDLLCGKSTFGELESSPENIPTNILAARLKAMASAGLVERELYQHKPDRYRYVLTARGEGLLPVLQAFCKWANAEFPETWRAPESFMKRRTRRAT